MKLFTVLRSLRTKRAYSAFAVEDMKPMSEVFVSWPKLFEIGWKVGGALILVSQGFTVLQLEIFRMSIKQDLVSLAASVSATQASASASASAMATMQRNMQAMQADMKSMRDNMMTMDEKLNKALPKKR